VHTNDKPASRIWSHQTGAPAVGGRYVRWNQRLFTLWWDEHKEVCRYEIMEGPAEPQVESCLDMDADATLVPALFRDVAPLPWSGTRIIETGAPGYLMQTDAPPHALPPALLLADAALERAAQSAYPAYALCCRIDGRIILVMVRQQRIEFLQRQEAENEHALMYWVVAAIRDRGLETSDTVCEILLNDPAEWDNLASFSPYFRYLGLFPLDGVRRLAGEDFPPDPLVLFLLARSIACA
jgi:hypothetical protein